MTRSSSGPSPGGSRSGSSQSRSKIVRTTSLGAAVLRLHLRPEVHAVEHERPEREHRLRRPPRSERCPPRPRRSRRGRGRAGRSVSTRCSRGARSRPAGGPPPTGRRSADASSMSWLMYAIRSTIRTILPSCVAGSCGPVCVRIPSRTSAVRLSRSAIRSDCSLWRKPVPNRSRSASSSACSPACPNGVWPVSWPSPIASTRSSLSRSARATTREIAVVSSVWVMRVR